MRSRILYYDEYGFTLIVNLKFLGCSSLVVRRHRWGLSWTGRFVAVTILFALGGSFIRTVHSFLALTVRVPSKVLVVEGWLHVPAMKLAAKEFSTGRYEYIITTGGPMPDTVDNDVKATWAESGAYWLRRTGVPGNLLQPAPSRVNERDRTFCSAVALRDWLKVNSPTVRSINVVTEGAHARRTRLLFQKALGSEFAVGIVATQNPEYDPDHWWKSSEGVRETMSEIIAYVYARFFFIAPT